MGYTFHTHRDAEDDLARIQQSNPNAWHYILVVFDEIERDERLSSRLLEPGARVEEPRTIDVKTWEAQWNDGRNLWRIRIFDLEDMGLGSYRIVYAPDHESRVYHILAIVERDKLNYDDPDDPLTQRICAAYAELGLLRGCL